MAESIVSMALIEDLLVEVSPGLYEGQCRAVV